MKQIFRNVGPIYPGYDTDDAITITYLQPFWDAMALGSGRLVAQFRKTIPGALLFEADTDDGTIVRSGTSLIIQVPGASSVGFPSPHVLFDVIQIIDADRNVIPGRWQWPVVPTVTRDVQ